MALETAFSRFLKPNYIPPKEQRALRDLTRYRKKLIESVSANKNRIIRILEDYNVKLSSILSSTSDVVGTKLIDNQKLGADHVNLQVKF